MNDIKTLVKRAKKGDGEAFISLVQLYEDILYRTASRILQNDEDTADVLQDTIMTAFEKLQSLRKDEYFNTWIYKILVNNCNVLLKKRNRFSPVDVHGLPRQATDDFQHIELEDALNSLHPDYKTAFTLYYITGLNTKEISLFLKEPEGTIKSRLSRGKSLLRNNYYKTEGAILHEN